MQFINSIDLDIMSFIRDYFKSDFLDIIMPIFSNMGNYGTIWILISLVLLFNKKYRHVGIIILATLLTATALGEGIIKHLVQRPRPSVFMDASELLIKVPNTYSFPSGHTATAFGAALVLSEYFRKYRLCFFIFASIIAFSRVYLFAHYPSDILGGIILGIISYKIVTYLFCKFYKEKLIEIKE